MQPVEVGTVRRIGASSRRRTEICGGTAPTRVAPVWVSHFPGMGDSRALVWSEVMTETFVKRSRLDRPAEEVFRWHTRPGAFERLLPPWEGIRVLERTGGMADGGRVTLRASVWGVPRRWVAEYHDYVDGREFHDRQIVGPFRAWDHHHRIEPDGPHGAFLEDRIEYVLPLGLGGSYVRRRLERVFAFRHRVTALDVAAHASTVPLTVWITGGSGFLGSALLPFLTSGGHRVVRLRRGTPLPEVPEGPFAVVHLSGESIASGRWGAAKKERIRQSRVEGTRNLAEGLARLPRRPEALVAASAVGFYGSRENELLTESSPPGEGFLADVCRAWEAAAEPARTAGIRVVSLRFGVILSPEGGALGKMLGPFRMGMGGRIGAGDQYMSWISREDAVGAIHHALVTASLAGAANAVAPEPVTNREFTKALGRVLGRPTVLPMPAFAARLAFGEVANELLLSSQRVLPRVLEGSGYRFRQPRLAQAFSEMFGREIPAVPGQ
jgi:uncharacterized protein (TIGR01777 family)